MIYVANIKCQDLFRPPKGDGPNDPRPRDQSLEWRPEVRILLLWVEFLGIFSRGGTCNPLEWSHSHLVTDAEGAMSPSPANTSTVGRQIDLMYTLLFESILSTKRPGAMSNRYDTFRRAGEDVLALFGSNTMPPLARFRHS